MSEFDQELVEMWLSTAEFWLGMCRTFPDKLMCRDCFWQAMESVRYFWPEHE